MKWPAKLFAPAPVKVPDPKDELKFIGEITNDYSWTFPAKKVTHKSTAHILFFMSENGRRKLLWPKIDEPKGIVKDLMSWPSGQAALAWEAGGKFPKDFEPVPDTLGPMLVRIVDIQMGLNKEGKSNDET